MAVTALPYDPSAHSAAEEQRVSDDTDAALVRAAQRDPTQFLVLYDRYFPRVYGYIRLRIRDVATCEDVTSQVFTTALAKIDSFHGGGSFSAWLFRIAQHAVYDRYRSQRTEQATNQTLDALPDSAPGPEEQALVAERLSHLRTLVETLRPDQQHLLALRYGAGLGFDEIGQIVGKSAGAVRVSVHRIRDDIRRRYSHDE